MALEKETVRVAMNGAGVIDRRHFLHTLSLGAAGVATSAAIPLSFPDWMALHADDLRKRRMASFACKLPMGSRFFTSARRPGSGATKSFIPSRVSKSWV